MRAYGGISIVNAIPCWLGSSAAVDLKIKVSIEETRERDPSESRLVKEILDFFEKRWNIPHVKVKVESDVPSRSGLKSSSAVSVALIHELYSKFSIENYLSPPKLSAILSIKAGVSYTGALDDAAASYYGGISFTDNKYLKIFKMSNPPKDVVVMILPRGDRPNVDLNKLKQFSSSFAGIFELAKRSIFDAMRINGTLIAEILGYDKTPINEAIKRGAIAAGISGNGPSYFALSKEGEEGPIYDSLKKFGEPILTRFVELEGDNQTI
jgi:shikimate kinase